MGLEEKDLLTIAIVAYTKYIEKLKFLCVNNSSLDCMKQVKPSIDKTTKRTNIMIH